MLHYHDDECMGGNVFEVQRLSQDQHATLGVQVEILEAVGVEAAVDGVDQPAVGVLILCTYLQDVLPGRCVFWDADLRNQRPDRIRGQRAGRIRDQRADRIRGQRADRIRGQRAGRIRVVSVVNMRE